MLRFLIFTICFIYSSTSIAIGIVPKNDEMMFDIYRKGKNIGFHSIIFNKIDEQLQVTIDVKIKVKLGFITIYKYSHENSEIWKENELIKINTNSITNSKDKYELNGQQNLENFEFIGIEGKQLTHKNIIPISYWNRDILDNNEFLDTQKGIIRKSKKKFLKNELIVFNNKNINTKKYELRILTKHSSDKKTVPEILLWYTFSGELMKLQFKSPEDNSIIDYIRTI